jgi:hypothetical protein
MSPIHSVALDRSTTPSTVVLNYTRLAFESESEAEHVFDLLNRTRDLIWTLNNANMEIVAGVKRILQKAGEL